MTTIAVEIFSGSYSFRTNTKSPVAKYFPERTFCDSKKEAETAVHKQYGTNVELQYTNLE